jgi:hypothetical protein
VAKEAITKALAIGSAFNKAWDICNQNCMVVNLCDAKIWRNGREWIIGDFWSCVRNNGKESRLAGIWETDETDICEKFELKFSIKAFTWVTELGNFWRLASRTAEVPVAVTAVATMSNDLTIAIKSKVSDNLAVTFYDSTDWNLDFEVFAGFAAGFLTRTSFAILGNKFWLEAKINQSITVFASHKNHITAFTAVATIWAAFRDVDFVSERDSSVATLAGFNINFRRINKNVYILT